MRTQKTFLVSSLKFKVRTNYEDRSSKFEFREARTMHVCPNDGAILSSR